MSGTVFFVVRFSGTDEFVERFRSADDAFDEAFRIMRTYPRDYVDVWFSEGDSSQDRSRLIFSSGDLIQGRRPIYDEEVIDAALSVVQDTGRYTSFISECKRIFDSLSGSVIDDIYDGVDSLLSYI